MSEIFESDRAGERDDAGIVLHEERLVAGVEKVETGRVEARKRIITEEVTITVPVRREVVDLVKVYPDGSEEVMTAPSGDWQPQVRHREAGEGDKVGNLKKLERKYDIVLFEERPVVVTEVYAVEGIRLGKNAEKDVVAVTETLAREVAEVERVDVADER